MVRLSRIRHPRPGDQIVILQTEPDGRLAALATGPSLGAYRTGALGGAAVDVMARADAATLGIIGTGQQAWTQVRAIAGVRALREVAVWIVTAISVGPTSLAIRFDDVITCLFRAPVGHRLRKHFVSRA